MVTWQEQAPGGFHVLCFGRRNGTGTQALNVCDGVCADQCFLSFSLFLFLFLFPYFSFFTFIMGQVFRTVNSIALALPSGSHASNRCTRPL